MRLLLTLILFVAVAAGCATSVGRYAPESLLQAESAIDAESLLAHINELASDRYEGRAPATEGERLTVEYLTAQFKALGLQPGNPDGTYVQEVPLVGISGTRSATLTANGKRMHMNFPDDYVALTRRFEPTIRLPETELVFVGYGVVAPEYDWDDYKDVDVRGKVIVMLINDPAIPDPDDPSRLDPKMFNGRAMTYYGRWTYKYEIAAEKGAAGALIVHETGPAGYPYEVLSGSWGRENFDIERDDGNKGRVQVEGWISRERAETLFRLSGHSLEAMKQAALERDFRPVTLPAKASFKLDNTLRRVTSKNVIARLDGADAQLKDQYVVYSAHWDHLGKDPALKGDQVFNGAHDNASGTAGLLELAQGFTRLPAPPKRSIVFLAVTAEEKGLLGSKWYAEHPLYPLTRTVANINMDGISHFGRSHDVVVVGKGQSTLEDVLADQVAAQGRELVADPTPEKGSYYRSDHFEFAKVGVPALYTGRGVKRVGAPEGSGQKQIDEFVARDYHKVSDEVRPDWQMSGGVEDLRLLLRVGLAVAEEESYPRWKEGSEFKARRDWMMRDASLR
ncbi:MAG TPA: M28 family metallopeptidase [Verrucomicrobiae bacterium]|nr:M28 family metallopeptidase [Verrucomicrobiae bacterium]